jgi:hypothetical protein
VVDFLWRGGGEEVKVRVESLGPSELLLPEEIRSASLFSEKKRTGSQKRQHNRRAAIPREKKITQFGQELVGKVS